MKWKMLKEISNLNINSRRVVKCIKISKVISARYYLYNSYPKSSYINSSSLTKLNLVKSYI